MNETLANSGYFTFTLGETGYAVPVTSVKEVISYTKVTPVPGTVNFMKGVMNIRGSVIPVIDFRVLFGLNVPENGKRTSIVICEVFLEDETPVTFGFIADAVEGVGPLVDEPSSAGVEMNFVQKLGRKEDRIILILDLVQIFKDVEDSFKTT